MYRFLWPGEQLMAELGALTFLYDEFMMDATEADPPSLLFWMTKNVLKWKSEVCESENVNLMFLPQNKWMLLVFFLCVHKMCSITKKSYRLFFFFFLFWLYLELVSDWACVRRCVHYVQV